MRAVATRYSGHYTPPGAKSPLPRVNFWSIWNEPNLGTFLAPETMNSHSSIEAAPRLYRGLVNAAWSALHATGHGSDTILIGEIVPAGSSFPGALKGEFGDFGLMPGLQFLRALYCVDSSYKPLTGAAATGARVPSQRGWIGEVRAGEPGAVQGFGVRGSPLPQGLAPDQVTPNEPDYVELAAIPKLERMLDQVNRLIRLIDALRDLVD